MTKVKVERVCMAEGCKFTTTSVKELQKHYEQDHSLKERVKGSLVISGHDYLPISGKAVIHKEQFLAGAIFILLGFFMITAPSLNLFVYAADDGGDSGSDSNDGGGGDSGGGGSNDNGGDSGGGETKQGTSSSGREDKQGGNNEGSQEEEKSQSEPDKPDNDQPDNNEVGSKGTEEEQEQAAIDDYVYEEPGIVKPYPSAPKISDKPIPGSVGIPKLNLLCSHTKEGCDKPTRQSQSQREEVTGKGNDPCNYYGRDICEGSKDGKTCNDEKFDCLSDIKGGNYCTTGKCPGDDQKWDCKKSPNKCSNDGGKGDWCKQHHGCDGKGHDDDSHRHHNNWCDHHDCHHHEHHSSTHFSDNHNGDVTVKIELDYKENHSNKLDDVELLIGDVYDKTLDLSDKPDQVTVNHLDIDDGDVFAICLANEDSKEGSCTVAEADSDHDTVSVELRVH